ncbi:MAG: hypothetical protein NVS4B6_16970 [Mycobacterium sp.]
MSGALTAAGWPPTPAGGSVQASEIAIDALDLSLVRPFRTAGTGYSDEPGSDLNAELIDPSGRGATFWFQQMDSSRPQRNRIHIDVDVPHDVARVQIDATVAAGGRVVSDEAAPAFWVLADPGGG